MRALIVDDEKNIRATLAACLEAMGHPATAVATGEAALQALQREVHELVFLDLRLGTEAGLELLPRILAAAPGVDVVIITAYATVETAVEAIQKGAADYLPKPFTPAQIRHVVGKLQAGRAAARRTEALERELAAAAPEATLPTTSPRMSAALELVSRAARAEAAVLLRGESGTGKGVLARALHAQSPRAAGPFVAVNCPTLSEELLASELFGHVRGAFTGAVRDQPGRVEAAEGGTLFLDEIGEISPALQVKLLRFLQEKEFERLGESRTRRADVRVVAATNRDLEEAVRTGAFREDLLYRLNVVEITVPPLRERLEDLLPLAARFLAFFAAQGQRRPQRLSEAARAALLAYSWPGNVRELRNSMERTAILWPGEVVEPAALPERIVPPESTALPRVGGDFTVEQVEKEHVLRVIARAPTLDEAARILGIDSSTLWRKRKRYDEG